MKYVVFLFFFKSLERLQVCGYIYIYTRTRTHSETVLFQVNLKAKSAFKVYINY